MQFPKKMECSIDTGFERCWWQANVKMWRSIGHDCVWGDEAMILWLPFVASFPGSPMKVVVRLPWMVIWESDYGVGL